MMAAYAPIETVDTPFSIAESVSVLIPARSARSSAHIFLRNLACALGNAACRKYKTVRYIRMPELLDELKLAKADGSFCKTIKAYQKVDLLIIDE